MLFIIPIQLFASLLAAIPYIAAHIIDKRYTAVQIQSFRSLKCLSPVGRSSDWRDGTQVTSVSCTNAVRWDINPGSGSILISGTNWALDAGTGDMDNAVIQLWDSYPGLFQQTWYYTNDQRIAITDGSQCLDEGENGPQTYSCVTGNTNQIWTIIVPTPPTSEVSPQIPVGTVYVDVPNGKGRRIHPYGRPDLCVMLDNGVASANQLVDIAYCEADTAPYVSLQLWNITLDSPSRVFLQSNPNLCLDAGQTPRNGGRLTVTRCGITNARQNWLWDGTTLALDSPNTPQASQFCLDVELNSPITKQQPYDRLERLQTWSCVEGNRQQIFSVFGDDPSEDCD